MNSKFPVPHSRFIPKQLLAKTLKYIETIGMQRKFELLVAAGIIGLSLASFSTYQAVKAINRQGDTVLPQVQSQPVLPAPHAPETAAPKPLPERHSQTAANVPEEITDPSAVERAAERAAALTGVRKDFILGQLSVETKLGENVGKCTYKQVSDGAEESHRRGILGARPWATFNTQRDLIRTIAADLHYDLDSLKVSCNPDPSQYVGTGGAMGVSQFMPTTWYEYKERIAKLSGKAHPDPWNVDDGILAMALKLSDVPGVTEHDPVAERRASKLYLSGTISSEYNWYAEDVQYWAENHNEILGEQYVYSLIFY